MELKEIKHYFFAHRNGVTADVLRRAGSPFGMIFGVEVPVISALARRIGENPELGRILWADSEVRESRLLAPWLFSPESLTKEECLEMAGSVRDTEDALMLAFRILKRRADAPVILEELKEKASHLKPGSSGEIAADALARHLE